MKNKTLIILIITFGQIIAQNNSNFGEIINLENINSEYDDFAPSWNEYSKKLYFNSTRSEYSKFYTATQDSAGFKDPQLLNAPLNKVSSNISYITFLTSETAFLSSFIMNQEGRPVLNIHKTVKEKMQWTKAFPVENLRTSNFRAHASVSPNGNSIVFATTVENEQRDTDLWIAYRSSTGEWGALTPIKKLNSAGNEITPHFASNDTLYFSSDGYGGPGGYDLYFTTLEMGNWTRPKPPENINTEFDESDPLIMPGGDLIFASDRAGGKGKLDLYLARRITKQKEKKVEHNISLNFRLQVPNIRVREESITVVSQIFSYANLPENPLINNLQDTLIERLKKDESKITIHSVNQSEKFADELKSRGINSENIKISSADEPYREFVPLSFENKFVRKPVKFELKEYKLIPPVLEVFPEARPKEKIKNWTCFLNISNNKYLAARGDTLPKSFFIDLKNKSSIIANADSLNIILEINNGTVTKQLRLDPVKVSIKSKNLKSINGRLYKKYLFWLADKNDARFNHFQDFLNYLKDISGDPSEIIIVYPPVKENILEAVRDKTEQFFNAEVTFKKNNNSTDSASENIKFEMLIPGDK